MNALSRILATVALFICSGANADVYTGHIASLEWKSYSSDAVLLVSVESPSNDVLDVKLLEVFHRQGDELTNPTSVALSWKPQLDRYRKEWAREKDWRPDGEWLLFVRKWEDSEPTIDHVVYLQNPRQSSWMSAVNVKGQLLMEKAEILTVVKNRLDEGKKMTPRQRSARKSVDEGTELKIGLNFNDDTQKFTAPWLGGFQIPASIDVWDDYDDPLAFDESLSIHSITVPADESFHEALLKKWTNYLQESPESQVRSRGRIGYPIFALVNYPGQKTEQLLSSIYTTESHRHIIALDAKNILDYLRLYVSSFDEQDRQLLGSWELTTPRERVQLDLLEDHQLIAHRKPIRPNQFEDEWFAKGRWNLHHGRLYLMSREYQLSTREKADTSARLPELDELPIVQIAKDRITFEKDTVLRRIPQPIPKVSWIR